MTTQQHQQQTTLLQQQQQITIDQDKLNKIKRKLKEKIELNESLSKGFLRAKKKIKILTLERNLLLDRLASINDHQLLRVVSNDINSNVNNSSSSSISGRHHHFISSVATTAAMPDDISIGHLLSKPSNRTITALSSSSSQHISNSDSNKKLYHHRSSIPARQQCRMTEGGTNTTQQQQQQSNNIITTSTTVASAPPKRSKLNRINIKTRRVQPIEKDELGHPKLPQQIGVLTVLNLGTIKTDVDTFHNERYIFPVGFKVKRTYPSMINPHNNTIITSTIIDGGDGSPLFHVVAADQPHEPIIANSATGAWTVVVKKSNEIRQREHSNSASGPDYYGFKHPTIAKMIQDLPGAKQLKNYVWQNFEEMEPRAAKGVMAAAEKKRDNLEHIRGGGSGSTISRTKKMDIASVVMGGSGGQEEINNSRNVSVALFQKYYTPVPTLPPPHQPFSSFSSSFVGQGEVMNRRMQSVDYDHQNEEAEEIDELEEGEQ